MFRLGTQLDQAYSAVSIPLRPESGYAVSRLRTRTFPVLESSKEMLQGTLPRTVQRIYKDNVEFKNAVIRLISFGWKGDIWLGIYG